MPEETNPPSSAEAEIETFCRQLLGSEASESLRDELMDHLRTALAQELGDNPNEVVAVRRVKDRFGDPKVLAAMLLDSQGRGVVRRAVEFLAAWLLVSGFSQLLVLVVWTTANILSYHVSWRYLLRSIPLPSLDSFMTPPTVTGLTQLCVDLVFTALLLHRWRKSPPVRRLWLIIALGVLMNLCFDSPLIPFFDSIARFSWQRNLSYFGGSIDLGCSGSCMAMIALGLIACRHVGVLDNTRAGLTCFALSGCIALVSSLRVLAIVLIHTLAFRNYAGGFGAFGSIAVFCIIAANVAWTIAYCIALTISLPTRFKFAR